MTSFFDSEKTVRSFVGKLAFDLRQILSSQAKELYQNIGLIFPPTCTSTMLQIGKNKGCSMADLATALEYPHQLITQRVNILLEHRLIRKRTSKCDKRRYDLELTKAGRHQLKLLEEFLDDAMMLFDNLNQEIEANLSQVLSRSIVALKKKDLLSRMEEIRVVQDR